MLCALGAFAQTPGRTVLDGVYTKAQAERGLETYTENCSMCHQPDLNGTGQAPALHSLSFINGWREGYLSSLYQHMHTWMPPGELKGTLMDQQYIDIISYLLAANEFPAGSKELVKADLNTTYFVGFDGPKPLPASATVRVVGCLAHGIDWTLTRATEPPRVRNGSDTDDDELAWSKQLPLGMRNYKLQDLEDDHPAAELTKLIGQKLQVKGVLNGQGDASRILPLSFQPLGQACDK
jgi:mono/diheme cytochrome c family protein